MQLNILVLSYVASAAVSGAVAVAAWRRRHMVGALGLALIMLAVGWWLLASALEAASIDRTAKIVWAVVSYPGIEFAPVLYLLFVLGWTRQGGRITRWRIVLLSAVPVASIFLAATNEWHHLLWPSVTIIDAWGTTAVYAHGPWFWVEVAYSYILIGVALLALIVAMFQFPDVYAARIRLAVVGSLAPVVGSLAYAVGFDTFAHADLSSVAFAIAGIVTAWAVLRSHLLDFVPVAWPMLVDSLSDAVIVLDPERRIASFNPSATRLLGVGGQAVGQPIDRVFGEFPELVALCRETADQEAEISMGPRRSDPDGPEPEGAALEATRWMDVRVTAVADGQGRDAGCLVVMRDITDRREMVETIRTLTVTDELTGLLNRRGFTTIAERQILTSLRTRNRLWLLFADVDGLKDINDRLGHEAGDRALREIARLLRKGSFRAADLVARLAGDEFAILGTEISRTDGDQVLKRVDEALRRANEAPGRDFTLSLSAGVAIFDPDQPQTLDELLDEADRRMYEAKHSQRADASRPR